MKSFIKNRRRTFIIATAVFAAVVLFILSGHRKTAEVDASVMPSVDVTAAIVHSMVSPVFRESPGTVRPRTESDIAAKIMSTATAVYVREGDRVKAGQVLLRLESGDLSAQVAQAAAAAEASKSRASTARTAVELQKAQSSANVATATAELDAAKQQLALAKAGPRPQERSQAQFAVVQAEAQTRNAEADYNRMKQLYDQGVISKQSLDSAKTNYDVQKAALDSAKQQYDMVEEGSRQEDIRSAEARVRQAEEGLKLAKASVVQNDIREDEARTAGADSKRASAFLDYAQVMAGYTVIRAPIYGLVTRRTVDPGDMVQPGITLLTIEESTDYRLEASVPEEYARYLSVGKKVDVTVDAADAGWTEATVALVVPAADRNSRTFTVKVSIPAGLKVRSGEFGRLRFDTGSERGLFVPKEAILTRNGLTGVFAVDSEGFARFRLVKTDDSTGVVARVLAGLSEGDRVVTSDTSKLTDGTPVKVKG